MFSAAAILILQSGVGPALQQDSFANKVETNYTFPCYQPCTRDQIIWTKSMPILTKYGHNLYFRSKVRVVVYQLCADELIEHPRDILANITEKLLALVKETVRQYYCNLDWVHQQEETTCWSLSHTHTHTHTHTYTHMHTHTQVTQRELSEQESDKVRAMVSALASPTNSVYCLLWARARQYFATLRY